MEVEELTLEAIEVDEPSAEVVGKVGIGTSMLDATVSDC